MSPALNVLRLPDRKRCRLAVADRRHDMLQAFSDKTIVLQETEGCVPCGYNGGLAIRADCFVGKLAFRNDGP